MAVPSPEINPAEHEPKEVTVLHLTGNFETPPEETDRDVPPIKRSKFRRRGKSVTSAVLTELHDDSGLYNASIPAQDPTEPNEHYGPAEVIIPESGNGHIIVKIGGTVLFAGTGIAIATVAVKQIKKHLGQSGQS